MEHATVTTEEGNVVEFYEGELAQVGGTVEVEVSPEVFETQTIASIEYHE